MLPTLSSGHPISSKIRIYDYQFFLRHAHEFLHLVERIIDLPIEKHQTQFQVRYDS